MDIITVFANGFVIGVIVGLVFEVKRMIRGEFRY